MVFNRSPIEIDKVSNILFVKRILVFLNLVIDEMAHRILCLYTVLNLGVLEWKEIHKKETHITKSHFYKYETSSRAFRELIDWLILEDLFPLIIDGRIAMLCSPFITSGYAILG